MDQKKDVMQKVRETLRFARERASACHIAAFVALGLLLLFQRWFYTSFINWSHMAVYALSTVGVLAMLTALSALYALMRAKTKKAACKTVVWGLACNVLALTGLLFLFNNLLFHESKPYLACGIVLLLLSVEAAFFFFSILSGSHGVRRFLSGVLVTALVLSNLTFFLPANTAASFLKAVTVRRLPGEKEWKLQYDSPAHTDETTDEDACWEAQSLPLGNGYMGLNVFGRTDVERVQISEKSLYDWNDESNRYSLNSFAEVYVDFGHKETTQYCRDLSLDEAAAHVSYVSDGVRYTREYFASYPDKVAVIHLTASVPGALSFTLRPTVPFTGESKSGKVTAAGNTLTLSGEIHCYATAFEGQLCVLHEDGELTAAADENGENAALTLAGATQADILIAIGTNYELNNAVFTQSAPALKLEGNAHPHQKVSETLEAAEKLGYAALRTRHVGDYGALFRRVTLDLGGEMPDTTTDELLEMYRVKKTGFAARYLEELYFQYGRYLLIAASRPGTLPANLQGTWNCHNGAPWGGGYFHNINVQMNYWPAFSCNLVECFEAYSAYNAAYMDAAKNNADAYMKAYFPDLPVVI